MKMIHVNSITHGDYMVLWRSEVSELMLVPNAVLNITPKKTSSYVLKTYFLRDLRVVLKNLAKRLYWKSQFSFLLHLENFNSFLKKLAQRLFGNLSFRSYINEKTFLITLRRISPPPHTHRDTHKHTHTHIYIILFLILVLKSF